MARVVVIGAGVIGLCVADSLAKRGYEVIVLERDPQPGNGCSYGNGGIIVPSHFVPLAAPGMMRLGLSMMLDRRSPFGFVSFDVATLGWIAQFMKSATRAHVDRCAPILRDLNLQSRTLYEKIVSELPQPVGFAKNGLLMLTKSIRAHAAESELAKHAGRLGLDAQVLNADEVPQLDPSVTMDVAGGVYFADDAHLTTAAFMSAMRERLRDKGVAIHDGVEVTGARASGNAIHAFETAREAFAGDQFVLAAGAWSGQLAVSLGLKLPMLAGKGYGFTVAPPPQSPTIPSILVEARVAMTPMLDGVRFVGTMLLGRNDLSVKRKRVEGMKRSIGGYYPAFADAVLDPQAWAGLRPCAPDGMPYVGRTKAASNLFIATGHAMMGMSLGPITGELIAQMISGDQPAISLEALDPDRFA